MAPEQPSGILVVDKPAGCTSHDVVERIRKIAGGAKTGHSGTLDPPATGVLLIGIGRATRLLTFLQGLPKSYRAVIQFGATTSTQDAEGEVLERKPSELILEQVEEAAQSFRGEIRQVPPMVSAVKIGGEPLYKAARRGKVVDRPARTVHVYRFEVQEFDPESQSAVVSVLCSSGTYVRTLAADLGDKLGCGAHLSALRRETIGSFGQDQSIALQELEKVGTTGLNELLIPMAQAMRDFPSITVEGEDLKAVANGRPLGRDGKLAREEASSEGEGEKPPTAIAIPMPTGPVSTPMIAVPTRKGELPLLSRPRTGDRPAHEAGMTSGVPVSVLGPDGELIAVYRRTAKGLKPEAVLA